MCFQYGLAKISNNRKKKHRTHWDLFSLTGPAYLTVHVTQIGAM